MTMTEHAGNRTRLADARTARIHSPAAAAAYEQATLRFELAEAIRTRREELGWAQRQLPQHAGMTQPGIPRFESCSTLPPLPLLERHAAALGLALTVSPEPTER